jgi:hypothetical protein
MDKQQDLPSTLSAPSSEGRSGEGRRTAWIAAALVVFLVALPILSFRLFRSGDPVDHQREKEWQQNEEQVDIPVKAWDGPKSFTLDFKPVAGKKYRFVFLMSQMDDAANRPAMRGLVTGSVAIDRRADGRIVVEYGEEKRRMAASSIWQEAKAEKNVLVSQDRKLAATSGRDGSAPPTLGGGDEGTSELITIDFPVGKQLRVGARWASRSSLGASLSHEIVGFAEVAGRKTVKVKTFTDSPMGADAKQGMSASLPPDLAALLKRVAVKETAISYVELETGLVVRRETEYDVGEYPGAKKKKAKGNAMGHMGTVVQLFEVGANDG